jgi:cysteine synthase
VGVEPKLGDRVQGLRSIDDGFRPPLLNLDELDGRRLVDNPSAIRAAEAVIKAEGISAGVSAGATLHAALKEAERMDSGNIVVMFSDAGWKYLPARPWEAAHRVDARLDDVHWW